MTKQYLSIQKLSFEINFFSQEKAYELQNKISSLYQHRLHTMLQDYFSAVIPESTLIRKDSLLLDLGTISYPELENELPQRLENALAELFPQLYSPENLLTFAGNNGFEIIPAPVGYAALLEHFLITGTLSWQANNQQQISWSAILEELFIQDRSHLAQLLKDLGKQLPVRKRLAYQSTEADFRNIITALEPVEAPVILTFKKKISAIQQEKQLVHSDAPGFAQAVSFFILTYLLNERGSQFSQKMFLKSTLLQMSAYFNVSYASLLAVLYQALPPTKNSTAGKWLMVFVQELQAEELLFTNNLPAPVNTNATPPALLEKNKITALIYYLQQGSLPAWSEIYSQKEMADFLVDCIKINPATFKEIILSRAQSKAALERVADLLSKQEVNIFIKMINHPDTSFIQEHLFLLEQWRESGLLPYVNKNQFKDAERKAVLLYLVYNYNLFDKEAFVKYSINYIANLTSTTPVNIWDGLKKTAQVGTNSGKLSSDYLQILQNIPDKKLPDSPSDSLSFKDLTEKLDPIVKENNLVDVLHYFLQCGTLPWWGEAYLNQAPETLLENLYALSAGKALLVLKRAGLQAGTRSRFLWQFSEGLVNKIFNLLPGWSSVADILVVMPPLLKAIPAFAAINPNAFSYSLRQAVWAGYINHGYTSFNQNSFLQNFLVHLSQLTTLEPSRTVHLVREAVLLKKREAAVSENLLQLRPLLETKEPLSFTQEDYSFYKTLQEWRNREEQQIKTGPDVNFQQPDKIADVSQTKAFLSLLEKSAKIPTWIRQIISGSPTHIAERLALLSSPELTAFMQFLAKDINAFNQFIKQLPVSVFPLLTNLLPAGKAALEFQEVFLVLLTRSVPALKVSYNIKNLIIWHLLWKTYQAQNFTDFNLENFVADVTKQVALQAGLSPEEIRRLWRKHIYAGADVAPNQTFSQLEQTINQINSEAPTTGTFTVDKIIPENIRYSNLDAWLGQLPGAAAVRTVADRQLQVKILLEYFLTYNRWPENFTSMTGVEQDNRLAEMLVLLYNEDRGALKQMLLSQKHAVNARLHLHQLFVPDQKGGVYQQLSLLLDEYVEQDARQYVKAKTQQEVPLGKDNLKTVVDKLLKKAERGKTEELTWLLQAAPLVKYMSRHYNATTLQKLVSHQTKGEQELHAQITAVRNLLLHLVPETAVKNRLQQQINEASLFYFSGPEPTKNITAYLKSLFLFLSRSAYISPDIFILLEQKLKINAGPLSAPIPLVQAVQQELQHYTQAEARNNAIKKEIEAEERQTQEINAAALQQKIQQELRRQQEAEQTTPKKPKILPEKGNKYYVNNAGLVLLHPFLGTYFNRLNLVEKGQFVSPEAQARAVHLLQYLAYDSTVHPESELVLNKILCNYPLPDSLPLEITVEPHEAALSSEMLEVIIQRAGKISSSSVDGFRVSFLHREGVLTETEEAWTLRVDQKGYDLLLQSLPWAFGMVKFGWMEKPLMVEWI